ncbi:NADH-quinone oxidoreductase subunit F [bacterium BMS3Bbin02]|nr:NADH-quinone oxidoreductase subunit F [bacterium BMS3Bbin02]
MTDRRREEVLIRIEHAGGLATGVSNDVHAETGVPEADVYGVATFYSLLKHPSEIRVCQGLSCHLAGSGEKIDAMSATDTPFLAAACLGRCDEAPASWDPQGENPLPEVHLTAASDELAINLAGVDSLSYEGLAAAQDNGADWVIGELEESGVTGRGGAGFPAHIKWRGVANQPVTERYVVLNADEGEPGTFKDREVILKRPHLVVEGLAIAAQALGANDIYCYVRGEFGAVRDTLEAAMEDATTAGALDTATTWHFVDGHGAYICGEETALLESLEGRRGMPRMKPPFPVEAGFRGAPTLIQNVETIATIPSILTRGGAWFRDLGRTEPGTKLYCVSGHVQRPGVYEAPMGISMAELIDMAGGVVGTLKAFSPGGASSGFLPASMINVALDFGSLQKVGSMLGSAGVVVLNDTVDMAEAALVQAVFFEDESCGQCAPCRIGTQLVRQAIERFRRGDSDALEHIAEIAPGMEQGSICGLGQAASLPLLSAMKYFPNEFESSVHT